LDVSLSISLLLSRAMALPPNWAKYTTEDGKEYYHNAVTNVTQWDMPTGDAPNSLSFHSGSSEVYQYRPTVSDLELHARPSAPEGGAAAELSAGALARPGDVEAGGGKLPPLDEHVSLRQAPTGQIGSGAAAGSAYTGFGNGFVGRMLTEATSEDADSAGVSGLLGSALSYTQQFFDVSSDDVIKRLRLSVAPLPGRANGNLNEFRARPDFWGPFWIATTGVLAFAASGNFARLLQTADDEPFKADYGLISVAATMLYGCLVAVPVITRALIYFTGQDANTINFRQMICVYGYSLTPIIPVSIVCLIPWEFLRWLACLGGLAASLAFMQGHLLADLSIEAPPLKSKVAAIVGVAQATIFLVYRLHFF